MPNSRHPPPHILAVLQNVLLSSPLRYKKLIEKFPYLLELTSSRKPSCVNEEEQKKITQATKSYLAEKFLDSEKKSTLADWQMLGPLQPILNKLSPTEKDSAISVIANSMADHAADSGNFTGVFRSKLVIFSKAAVKPLFGKEKSTVTDFSLARTGKGIFVPHLLGFAPISGEDKPTPYGFFHQAAAPFQVNTLAGPGPLDLKGREKVKWAQAGKTYSAEISLNQGELRNGKTDATSFPKLLRGLIVPGANLNSTTDTIKAYRQFYEQKRGYQFEKPFVVEDMKRWLLDRVEGKTRGNVGPIDYLFKEAHSDGDEKNLFRLNAKMEVSRGFKKTDGGVEEVFLASPLGTETVLLSNQEFGQAISQRTSPLTYGNASCSSHTKAVNEISAIPQNPKNLIEIATLNSTDTFRNTPKKAPYELLNGLLDNLSFEEIRKAMAQDEEYKSATGNGFILPDEYKYQELVTSLVETPIDVRIKITGPDGRPYNLDDSH